MESVRCEESMLDDFFTAAKLAVGKTYEGKGARMLEYSLSCRKVFSARSMISDSPKPHYDRPEETFAYWMVHSTLSCPFSVIMGKSTV